MKSKWQRWCGAVAVAACLGGERVRLLVWQEQSWPQPFVNGDIEVPQRGRSAIPRAGAMSELILQLRCAELQADAVAEEMLYPLNWETDFSAALLRQRAAAAQPRLAQIVGEVDQLVVPAEGRRLHREFRDALDRLSRWYNGIGTKGRFRREWELLDCIEAVRRYRKTAALFRIVPPSPDGLRPPDPRLAISDPADAAAFGVAREALENGEPSVALAAFWRLRQRHPDNHGILIAVAECCDRALVSDLEGLRKMLGTVAAADDPGVPPPSKAAGENNPTRASAASPAESDGDSENTYAAGERAARGNPALEPLFTVLESDTYSPDLAQAFLQWRRQMQTDYFGMSNHSEIPNWEFNQMRFRVVATVRRQLRTDPGDAWAWRQLEILLGLDNIARGGLVGNSNLFYRRKLRQRRPIPGIRPALRSLLFKV